VQYSPWIAVGVSVAVALLGIGGNLAVVSFFLGKLKAEQAGNKALVDAFKEFTDQTINALLARMHTLDQFASESAGGAAAMEARVKGIEENTRGFQQLREDFARHSARQDAVTAQTVKELERLSRSSESVQRQISNLARMGPGALIAMEEKGV
jgi:hypothetical protein